MMLECWFFVKDSPLSNTLHNVANVELYISGIPTAARRPRRE
jgi:hypothetical protein